MPETMRRITSWAMLGAKRGNGSEHLFLFCELFHYFINLINFINNKCLFFGIINFETSKTISPRVINQTMIQSNNRSKNNINNKKVGYL